MATIGARVVSPHPSLFQLKFQNDTEDLSNQIAKQYTDDIRSHLRHLYRRKITATQCVSELLLYTDWNTEQIL